MLVPFAVAAVGSVLVADGKSSGQVSARKAVIADKTLYLMTENDRLVAAPLEKGIRAKVYYPARKVMPPVPGCWDVAHGSLYLTHTARIISFRPNSYIVKTPIDSLPTQHDCPEREQLLATLPFTASGGEYLYNPIPAHPLLGAQIRAEPAAEGAVILADMYVSSDSIITIGILQDDDLRTSTFDLNDKTAEWELESSLPFQYRLAAFAVVRTSKGTTVFSENGMAYQVSEKTVQPLEQRKRAPHESKEPAAAPDDSHVLVVDKRKATVECGRFTLRDGTASFCPDYREEKATDRDIAVALERALTALAQ